MRDAYKAALKTFLHHQMKEDRKKNHLIQEKMAEILEMDLRSYADIENGKNMCNTVTFLVYLLEFYEDPNELLDEIRDLFEKVKREHG